MLKPGELTVREKVEQPRVLCVGHVVCLFVCVCVFGGRAIFK